MDAVVLVFHGSGEAGAADEAARIASALRARLAPVFVARAFLRGAEPSVPAAIAAAVAAGATRVALLPLLVLPGSHLARDIPALVAGARRDHPGVEIRALAHLGADSRFPELLAALVRADPGA